MPRRVDTGRALATGVLALAALASEAQTIADYSRVQRSALEAAMTQAAARAAAPVGASPVASAAVQAASAVAASSAARRAPLEPQLQVDGVFLRAAGAVAEVVVDGVSYLLRIGEPVPGTAWRVESVAVDRVVLRSASGTGVDGVRRTFLLPSLP